MATIDDIRAVERLMQTLDENPHLMEAVRSRLLTRELLELPQIVARLAERVEQVEGQLARLTEQVAQLTGRVEQVEGQLARLTEQVAQLTGRVEQVEGQLARLTEQVAQLTGRVDQLTERVEQVEGQLARLTDQVAQLTEQVAQLTGRVDQLTGRVEQVEGQLAQLTERMDRRFNQVANDLNRLKERAAMDATREQSHVIAMMLGLRRQLYLHGNEIIDLARLQNTTDISVGDLASFHRADLLMEATDAAGETHYIAVEVSFTADARDTRRAIRNAEYLTRFTGRPAHAVVAAFRRDREIQPAIDSGQVFWYQLDEDDED